MKQKFSTHWNASIQPRKQRKYTANAPLHIRHKFVSANLSKDLRKKYSRRSFPVRKNDEIKIMRGEFKGKKGKIESVDLKYSRVIISGIFRTKKDGTKVQVYFNPSNLQIQELSMDDKKRIISIGKEKKASSTKVESKTGGQNVSKKK
jgi:large subunit ribosomal protein L24